MALGKFAAGEPQLDVNALLGLRVPLSEHEVSLESAMTDVGLNPAILESANAKVPISKYFDLMEHCALLREDPLFSLRLARSAGPEAFGALGFLYLSMPTLRDAIQEISRGIATIQTATILHIVEDPDVVFVKYEVFGNPRKSSIQDCQYSVFLLLRMVNIYFGRNVSDLKIYFRHDPLAPEHAYRDILKTDLTFRAEFDGISFPARIAGQRGGASEPHLAAILKATLERNAGSDARQGSFSEYVSSMMVIHFPSVIPNASDLAALIGISTSSLHRRLARDGTSLRKLKDERTLHLAREYLLGSRLTITETALRCGFGETASFIRSFRRISGGFTPNQFRQAFSPLKSPLHSR